MTGSGTLDELTLEECLELAATQQVGRIAVAPAAGAPLVVPVNFVLDGPTVVFSSDPGRKLTEVRDHRCSFQVDWIDPTRCVGWSVLFQGDVVDLDPNDPAAVSLHPWVGPLQHALRLVPVTITGRQIRLHLPEVDDRGYR